MDMDELKVILNTMIDSKVLCNIGKEGNESFKIYEEENFQSMDEIFSQTSEVSESTNNIDQYINAQFYETLITRIKTEVNLAVETKFLLSEQSVLCRNNNHTSSDNNYTVKGENDTLINSFNSEIAFLRSELASKNKIIEMMIKDNSNKYDIIHEIKLNDAIVKNIQQSKSILNYNQDKRVSSININKNLERSSSKDGDENELRDNKKS